jgi:hypothetical protein
MTERKPKATAKKAVKSGRNPDGTFAKGNKPKITENTGRPSTPWSVREQAKLRAKRDPALIKDLLNTLIRIAKDPEHSKCIEAADKLIKLLGNYDPAENKTELSGAVTTLNDNDPLSELTRADLLKILKRKR